VQLDEVHGGFVARELGGGEFEGVGARALLKLIGNGVQRHEISLEGPIEVFILTTRSDICSVGPLFILLSQPNAEGGALTVQSGSCKTQGPDSRVLILSQITQPHGERLLLAKMRFVPHRATNLIKADQHHCRGGPIKFAEKLLAILSKNFKGLHKLSRHGWTVN
jgi:hypothetical protein